MTELDRMPPHSPEAECSVLGSMLRDNGCVADVVRLPLRADDFYADAHRKVFQAIIALHDKGGQPVDVVLLAEELKRRGQIEDVGSYAFLGRLLDSAPTSANAVYYAGIVRERSIRRNVIHFASGLLRNAHQPDGPAVELLRKAEQGIFALSELGAGGEAVPLSQALGEAADDLDAASARLAAGDETPSGLATGHADLDDILSGVQPEEVVFVGARPSVGKTTFAAGVAAHVATHLHTPVLFVSLEQSRKALAKRLWCAEARVDSRKVRRGCLNKGEWESLIKAKSTIDAAMGRTLFIDDTPGQDMLRVAANARRLRRRDGVGLIVIDYLQLIEPDDSKAKRWEQVGAISRRLKSLAKELGVPLLVLTQLNRESESRKDGRPRLADLREGGQQEQDADIVLLLHRADQGDRLAGPHVPVEVIVAKNRDGPVGATTLYFNGPYVRFDGDDRVFH